MTIVRKTDLARAIGVHPSTITRAAQAGRLVLAGDDRRFFDLDASVARYRATQGGRLDVQARHAAGRAARNKDEPAGKDTKQITPISSVARVDGQDRPALQAARLAAENAITKIDLGLLKGSQLLLAGVSRESQSLGARLVAQLRRVVDQFAARLAAAHDHADRARLLRRELHMVGRAFDRDCIASMRRLRASGRVGRSSSTSAAKETTWPPSESKG